MKYLKYEVAHQIYDQNMKIVSTNQVTKYHYIK